MSKLKSLFGASVQGLQVMVDKSKDLYAPLWYPKYFDVAPPQQSLTWATTIGRSRIEAAATVVDRDAKTPLRSRQGLEKLSGAIPAIKEMFALKESDLRDYMALQNMPGVDDATKFNQILDLIWGDVKKAGDSCHKRVDAFAMMAISNAKVFINTTNNPDGVVHDDIDLLMAADNKKQASVSWDTTATTKPITDIETIVEDAAGRGIAFAKILMSKSLFLKFRKAKEVVDALIAYFYASKPGAGFNPVAVSTLDRINEFLDANKLPVIEIVDGRIGIEKDGIITSFNFFNENNAVFIPAGKLGTIKNALAIEKLRPVKEVEYADYNKVLISKWSENEPYQEFTKGEWNAFPSFEAIDTTYILTAVFGG